MTKVRILLAVIVVVSGLLAASIVDSIVVREDLSNQSDQIDRMFNTIVGQSETLISQTDFYEEEIARIEEERDFYKEQMDYWKSRAAYSGTASGDTDRMNPGGFESIEELGQWLADSPIPDREFIWRIYDCDNFAIDLSLEGFIDGKWVGLAGDDHHWFNFTYINNDIIRIEPQTREYEYWGPID
jgi:hypothetical protein